MPVFFNGLLLGFSLIIALGPQNVFLIKQGALRQHAVLSALICFVCDLLLIAGSVTSLHHTLERYPNFQQGMVYAGMAFLLGYGIRTLYNAFKKKKALSLGNPMTSRLKIILLALGFSLLNPHAIIDSLIIIGANSMQFADHLEMFTLGVGCASLLWFCSLTFLTYHFSTLLTKPHIWRQLEMMSGLLMIAIGFKLGMNLNN